MNRIRTTTIALVFGVSLLMMGVSGVPSAALAQMTTVQTAEDKFLDRRECLLKIDADLTARYNDLVAKLDALNKVIKDIVSSINEGSPLRGLKPIELSKPPYTVTAAQAREQYRKYCTSTTGFVLTEADRSACISLNNAILELEQAAAAYLKVYKICY